ncbi:fungal specific transcription factor domain-containing [Fusarium albosuccineum]|uniref:Fungal specific transcription factor domain-containing n=1 Tax=Fusarium albosuccineum TaxID=1237068 RepID=A0A8H4NX67_9HYPO|nr:fungal specific transcription factor domain-containing [Fusarium albosuccineum]
MESRLEAMEALLIEIKSSVSQQSQRPSLASNAAPTTVPNETPSTNSIGCQEDMLSSTDGPSSLTAQTIAAKHLVEDMIRSDPLGALDVRMSEAVTSLGQIVDSTTSPRSEAPTHQKSPSSREIPLAVVGAIREGLKLLQDKPAASFPVLRCLMSVDSFTSLCQDVVFSLDGYSESDFTVIVGGLYYLFNDYLLNTENDSQREHYSHYKTLCREALDSSIATMSALLPTRMQSIRALILGSSHAIETSKPWVAWRLIGLATHLCLAMGYHDSSSMTKDDEKTRCDKLHLFWHVYAVEKGLALRLGRPSIIRDHDISVTDDLHILPFPEPWPEIMGFWVENARIQGQVYELLYSHAAVSDPHNDLAATSDVLLDKIKAVGSRKPYSKDSQIIVP